MASVATPSITPQMWLSEKYPMMYDSIKNNPETLYFDARCWTTKSIQEFFDDVQFADYHVWERYMRTKKTDAEKRYMRDKRKMMRLYARAKATESEITD